MSFKPFGFSYTPPATVNIPAVVGTSVSTTKIASQSKAGELISTLDDLTTMAQYLQDAIVSRVGAMAVEVDPTVDPNMARALIGIYGSTPPNLVAVAMYDQLLDASLGTMQLEMAVGNTSTIQANPLQVGDLMTITKTVEDALINSPSYNSWLPLQLATLKGDSVVFQSWKQSLQSYPAYYAPSVAVPETYQPSVIQASTVDVSRGIKDYSADALNRISQSYASIYQSMALPSTVENDIGNIVSNLITQPLPNLMMMSSLMSSLIGLVHKSSMDDLQRDANNYSFIRLSSDTIGMLSSLDQLVQIATNPLQGALGSLSGVVAKVQGQIALAGRMTSGVLAGSSASSECATNNPSNRLVASPGLDSITAGVKALAESLEWAQYATTSTHALITTSVRQLMERRIKAQNDRNSLMCSIRALSTLTNLAGAITHGIQNGIITSDQNKQQESVNSILNSLETGSGTTFAANSGQIVVNPPTMPTITAPVQRILRSAKINVPLGISTQGSNA